MRTPHRITDHFRSNQNSPNQNSPNQNSPNQNCPSPYDGLGALDDGPLEDFLHEDEPMADVRDANAQNTNAQGEEWTPPNHRRGARRRRKRFAGLPFAMKTSVLVLTLAAFLTLADRWALLYAEQKAADKLKDQLHLSAAPEVEIGGFPFFTQLADGRLDSVKVTVPDVAADRVTLAKVSATATHVRIDSDGPTSVRGARIPELHGEVLLSFADLNRELGASQVTFTGHGGDQVRAHGTLPAIDHPELLRSLGLDPALLDGLSRLTRPVLADQLSLSFRLPRPADGQVRLRDVRVEKDGIRVRVTGSALAIGR